MGTFYNVGKTALFQNGWVSSIDTAKLYTSGNVEVASASCSFVYSGGVLTPTADIVFSIAAGTTNVAYVVIGDTGGGGIFVEYYKENLSTTYSFPTAGTLTIDAWGLNIAGTYLLAGGEEALFETGFTSLITQAKLYTSSDALVDTKSVTMTVNGSYALALSSSAVFNVTGGTLQVYYVTLCDSVGNAYYKRLFSTTYNFPTTGTFTISDWAISI